MKSLRLLSLVVLVAVFQLGDAFEYPRNVAEKRAVEAAFERILANNNESDTTLDAQLVAQETKTEQDATTGGTEASERAADGENSAEEKLRNAELIRQYANLEQVNEEKCSIESVSEQMFLLKFHSDEPQSRLYKYLNEISLKQSELCLARWEGNLLKRANDLDANVRAQMEQLIESLVAVTAAMENGADSLPVQRPFEKALLAHASKDPKPEALVRFVNAQNAPLGLDEYGFNPNLPWEAFYSMVQQTIGGPCRYVCEHLRPATAPYGYLFDENFDRTALNNRVGPQLSSTVFELLATKSICCRLGDANKSNQLFGEAWRKIVDAPQASQYDAQYGDQNVGQYGSPYGNSYGNQYGGQYGGQYVDQSDDQSGGGSAAGAIVGGLAGMVVGGEAAGLAEELWQAGSGDEDADVDEGEE